MRMKERVKFGRRKMNSIDTRYLPLLDYVKNQFDRDVLKNTYILAAQHLVSTSHALFEAFFECGLERDSLSLIGKCYSTNPEIYHILREQGIDVCPSSISFDPMRSFDEQYKQNVREFFSRKIAEGVFEKGKKIIILDDGGFLLEAANEYVTDHQMIVGIEQTTSGYMKLKDQFLKFPIVNLARSFAKLEYESPIIAQLIKDSLVRHLSNLKLKPKKPLIIGNGAIGQAIYSALASDYPKTKVFDVDVTRSHIFPDEFAKILQESDLIIGCVGKTVVPQAQHHLLKKGAVLISASSSDREFDAVFLREKGAFDIDCHAHLHLSGVYLMNSGFPINFDNHYREIDVDELQLTRTLIFASVMQASLLQIESGFIPLKSDWQRDIVNKFTLFADSKFADGVKASIG